MQGRNSIRSRSSTVKWLAAFAIATAAAGTARATVVFSDTLNNGSVLEPSTYPTPTSNSTGYDIASAKDGTPADGDSAVNTGDLELTLPSSSGAIVEAQALFTNSPITLSSAGQYVELTTTFKDTAGTPTATYFGLFNSNSTYPTSINVPSNAVDNGNTSGTNANEGLNSGDTNAASGGAAAWTGYAEQLMASASSHLVTRPAQTGTSNTNQDLLGNDVSSSQAYDHPAGTVLNTATTNAVASLVVGDTYTEDFIVTLTATAPDSISVTSNLYAGADDTGTLLATQTGVDASATTTTFDALAFGWRENNSVAAQMDYSSISVSSNAVAPEPGALSLLALASLGLRRRK